MRMVHVTNYNQEMFREGRCFEAFTVGNGSILDQPRVRGWVVCNNTRAKWLPNKREAIKYLQEEN